MKKIVFFIFILLTSSISAMGDDVITQTLTTISQGPNIIQNCDSLEENVNSSTAPQTYLHFGLRNDAFAVPFTALKNRYLVVWDMGETTGSELKLGHQFASGHELNIQQTSKLFTQIAFPYYLTTNQLRRQEFTTETITIGEINNFNTDERFQYSVAIGKINYISIDNDSPLSSTGQQKILHHNIDNALGINLIDIENVDTNSRINGKSIVFIPTVGVKFSPSEDLSVSPYLSGRLSTIPEANNITAGTKIHGTKKGFGPNHQFVFNIDLPVTVYNDYYKESPAIAFIPKISISSSHKNIEYGFQFEKPFGNWRMNIPQNVANFTYTPDLREISDEGEMGTIFFRIKK